MGCHALLQGIFPTQELNPYLLCLPALAGGVFTISATWEDLIISINTQFNFHITSLVPNKAFLCEKYLLDILIKEYIIHRKFMNMAVYHDGGEFIKEMTQCQRISRFFSRGKGIRFRHRNPHEQNEHSEKIQKSKVLIIFLICNWFSF